MGAPPLDCFCERLRRRKALLAKGQPPVPPGAQDLGGTGSVENFRRSLMENKDLFAFLRVHSRFQG
jgi:hypothetical protein